jgi:ribosomal protein S18 acetylase RimI-like enzyme
VEYTIRPAELDDSDAIGNVHVRAWQGAYRGVMPDEYLDGLRAEDRATMWRGYFAVPRPDHQLTVVVHAGEVVGFAASGPEAGESARSDVGELYAINLDPSSWGKGFGRALLREVTEALATAGYGSAVLWVAPQNTRARSLYESEGWIDDDSAKEQEVLGVTVSEIRYRRALGVA